jgi:hypothetical protein
MDTTRSTSQEHRRIGRGRKTFWVVAALAAVSLAVWWMPGRDERHSSRRTSIREGRGGRLFQGDLAAELARHADMLAWTGLSAAQVERVAAIVDERAATFEELEAGRTGIQRRVAAAVAAGDLDANSLAALREDAKVLAGRTLDASFDLVSSVAVELTPAQRADVVRHWAGQ